MENYFKTILLLLSLLLIAIIGFFIAKIYDVVTKKGYRDNLIELAVKKYKFEVKKTNMQTNINIDTINLLETYVKMIWNEVKANNIALFAKIEAGKGTMTDDDRNKLKKELTSLVNVSMSQELKDKLLLIYSEKSLNIHISNIIRNIIILEYTNAKEKSLTSYSKQTDIILG